MIRLAYPGVVEAQGWYRDPYGLHTDRWMSDGTPTALVRDGRIESRDEPPDRPFVGELIPSAEAKPRAGDTRRADASTRNGSRIDRERMYNAIIDGAFYPGSGMIDP